jgi:uncharacterized membrane protein
MSTMHVHLLLNHFPTVGFVLTLGLFLAGIVARSDHLKRASLVAFIAIALIAIPTYVTGNAAAEKLCIAQPNGPCADPSISRPLIERHEGAALLSLLAMMMTAAAAWLGLWEYRRLQRLLNWTIVFIALLSLLALGLVARAANIGGEIRHPEVRVAEVSAASEPTLGRTIAQYVNEEPWIWIASETLHFMGLSLLVGIVLLIDLRTLGVMNAIPFPALDRLLPWAALGFGLNIVTGMLFFVARPEFYTRNPAFYWKLLFVLLASANTLYFFFDEGWTSQPGTNVRLCTKIVAASALALWVGVMYWGSMLPFIGNSF